MMCCLRYLICALALLTLVSHSFAGSKDRKKQLNSADELVAQHWFDVAIYQDQLYRVGTQEIRIEDPSNPAEWTPVQRINLETTFTRIQFHKGKMFVAAGSNGLLWFTRSAEDVWEYEGRFDTPGNVRDFKLIDNLGYLADGVGGLRVIDIRDLTEVRQIASVASASGVRAIAIQGDVLATAEGSAGVRLFRIRSDGKLRPNYRVPECEGARDITFAGSLLVVAQGRKGVVLLDPGPTRAVEVAVVSTTKSATHVSWAAPYAFVAQGSAGIQLIQIENKQATVVSEIKLPGGYIAERMTKDGDRLYVTMGTAGVAILDIANPELPKILRPSERKFTIEGARR